MPLTVQIAFVFVAACSSLALSASAQNYPDTSKINKWFDSHKRSVVRNPETGRDPATADKTTDSRSNPNARRDAAARSNSNAWCDPNSAWN